MTENISGNQDDVSEKNIIDKDGNEIFPLEKWVAGILLIFFTTISTVGIIAYWPDRLPDPKKNIAPLYQDKMFNICLIGIPDSICCPDSNYKTIVQKEVMKDSRGQLADSTESVRIKYLTDSILKANTPVAPVWIEKTKGRLIHLNTLLLLLVALGGFLGNMIHLATSFTTFIGAGKFKRSWLLWYCLKPFTASSLAIGIYFIFRAGFLNMSDGGQSINLYGLMSISILAGLFTDKATEKLKEIFEVIFKSKEVRPDTLADQFKITGISPSFIEKGKENKLTIAGVNLDKQKLFISINDEKISNPVFASSGISLTYTIPDTQKDKTKFKLSVKDEKGKEHFTAELTLKE